MPRRLQRALTIHELQRQARDRVPRMFYEYADSGSWTRSTYDANESDFGRVKFRQRILVDMDNRSLATKMAGQDVGMPVALAPTGMCGMQHANGEIHAARAAEGLRASVQAYCTLQLGYAYAGTAGSSVNEHWPRRAASTGAAWLY